jgi:hypothetical protein
MRAMLLGEALLIQLNQLPPIFLCYRRSWA